ncbi:MAG: hypothetical protein ACLQUT_03555 [Thermoleophilia bacterium]
MKRRLPPARKAISATVAEATLCGPVVLAVSSRVVRRQYVAAVTARGGNVANLHFTIRT